MQDPYGCSRYPGGTRMIARIIRMIMGRKLNMEKVELETRIFMEEFGA